LTFQWQSARFTKLQLLTWFHAWDDLSLVLEYYFVTAKQSFWSTETIELATISGKFTYNSIKG